MSINFAEIWKEKEVRTNLLDRPLGYARMKVVAARSVLQPYLDTRPVVGEHVICVIVKKQIQQPA